MLITVMSLQSDGLVPSLADDAVTGEERTRRASHRRCRSVGHFGARGGRNDWVGGNDGEARAGLSQLVLIVIRNCLLSVSTGDSFWEGKFGAVGGKYFRS